jgi:hypothetical protein
LYSGDSLRLLLLLAARHAVARGAWSLYLAAMTWPAGVSPVFAVVIGVASFGSAGVIFRVRSQSLRDGIGALALYTCFAGILLLAYALQLRKTVAHR